MSDDTKVVDIVTKRPYFPRELTADEVVEDTEDTILWCCGASNFKIISSGIYCSSCLHKMEGYLVLNPDDLGLAPPEDGVHEDD